MAKIYKLILLLPIFYFLFSIPVFAYQINLTYLQEGNVNVKNPLESQFFYDELKGDSKKYTVEYGNSFLLQATVLTPAFANKQGKYSIRLVDIAGQEPVEISFINGQEIEWQEIYDPFMREYYYRGSEIYYELPAGKYELEISSLENTGKYILSIGKLDFENIAPSYSYFWQIPFLKASFLQSNVLEFFLTIYGIILVVALGAIIILLSVVNYLVSLIETYIKHKTAKTLLLTSSGMDMSEEIKKLLQKPAYDVNLAFIDTAAKVTEEPEPEYMKRNLDTMMEMGFNVSRIDIAGKTKRQLSEIFNSKDIIFVEDGNIFALSSAMKNCGFKGIIQKLLKNGVVYIGSGAGSIIAGKSIKTFDKFKGNKSEKNNTGMISSKGLELVPFDIFVNYQPEDEKIIKKKIWGKWRRTRKLKILANGQALLIQGKRVFYIGKGDQIII